MRMGLGMAANARPHVSSKWIQQPADKLGRILTRRQLVRPWLPVALPEICERFSGLMSRSPAILKAFWNPEGEIIDVVPHDNDNPARPPDHAKSLARAAVQRASVVRRGAGLHRLAVPRSARGPDR